MIHTGTACNGEVNTIYRTCISYTKGERSRKCGEVYFMDTILFFSCQVWLICIQRKSVQCPFHVDTINLNQHTFNAHYLCHVDRPSVVQLV